MTGAGETVAADEAALLQESAQDLYENAPCGYLSTRLDGTIVKVNQTFLTWMGRQRKELLGCTRFQDLLTAGGRIYHETHYAPMLNLQGSVREIAVELVRGDGTRLPVLLNSVLKTDEDGVPVVIRTTVFDATDRREYERELLRARREEREAHERTNDVALTLQRSLLAGTSPQDPRLVIASRYRPADDSLEIGGDWHDALSVSPEEIALVVGDVVGKGIAAASAMGQLKSATRALAVARLPPAELLTHLDSFVDLAPATQMSTLIFAVVDLSSGQTRFACAGHPPPVLIPVEGKPTLIWEARSRPLGLFVEGSPRVQASFALEPGARLLCFTDGLIERRGESIDAGLDRLLDAVERRRGTPIDLLLDQLVDELLTDAPSRDDACLLGIEFRGT
jgi:sigma-B regulation protein RsbU (phosphoserine phosphatase)